MDFGRGFYMSSEFDRAVSFAQRKVDISGGFPVVYAYILDDSALDGYRVKRFDEANEEWFDYVVANRTGIGASDEWDMVIGATADERVRNIINMYVADPEVFDKNALIKRLRPDRFPSQYVIKTKRLIDELEWDGKTIVEADH
jgi:hypothetical protein